MTGPVVVSLAAADVEMAERFLADYADVNDRAGWEETAARVRALADRFRISRLYAAKTAVPDRYDDDCDEVAQSAAELDNERAVGT